jgi:Fe-S-cluster containining protein
MPNVSIRKRNCDSCNLCCFYLEIESKPGYSTRLDTGEDIAKPARSACRFLNDQGCSIYESRPLVCRQFRCDWLLGAKGFGPEDSPNRSGIMGVRGERWLVAPHTSAQELARNCPAAPAPPDEKAL